MRFRHQNNFRHHAFAFLRRGKKDAARRRVNRKHFVALNFHLDAVPERGINAAERSASKKIERRGVYIPERDI